MQLKTLTVLDERDAEALLEQLEQLRELVLRLIDNNSLAVFEDNDGDNDILGEIF